MTTVIFRDGVPDSGSISIETRGVLHGYGVFEVLRAYGGRCFRFEAHCTRLQRSLARLQLELGCSVGALAHEVSEAIRVCGCANAHVRVLVTLGEGVAGLSLAGVEKCTRWVIVNPMPSEEPPVTAPVRLRTVHAVQRGMAAQLARIKSNNYALRVIVRREAELHGFDDGLVFDGEHYWEASAANLFCVHEGVLSTPPVSGPILEGVTRNAIMDCAEETGVIVNERLITAEALWTADEVFLTSSIREVVSVSEIDAHELGPNPTTERLRQLFRQLVRRECLSASERST